MTLPRPPADPLELAGAFPSRDLPTTYPFARIHRHDRDAEWFCHATDCRFDPPKDAGFGTCYLATQPLGAFIEKFGRFQRGGVPRSLIDAHRLAILGLPSPLRAADATDRTILGRWGLSAELWAGDDYDGAQQWAHRLHQAGFGAIWYPASHDTRGGFINVALFGKPGYAPDAFVPYADELIPIELCDEAADEFGIHVVPAAPL
jgi:hypothetical protein